MFHFNILGVDSLTPYYRSFHLLFRILLIISGSRTYEKAVKENSLPTLVGIAIVSLFSKLTASIAPLTHDEGCDGSFLRLLPRIVWLRMILRFPSTDCAAGVVIMNVVLSRSGFLAALLC